MATLLLRLEGPMQSWGITSRYTIRETGLEPSKSGLIGLVAAALGKPRVEDPANPGDWPRLTALAALRMGVRVDLPGRVEREYQVAGGGTFAGRPYGVAKAENPGLEPLPSQRFYLADAAFLVGLEGDLSLLERIASALKRPVWPLSLGRKSYVPGAPVYLVDGLRPAEDLRTALTNYPALRPEALAAPVKLVLEVDLDEADETRRDQPLDFATRRFGLRGVKVESLTLAPVEGR
jgi:CRISPR system Cascade subunit CasD